MLVLVFGVVEVRTSNGDKWAAVKHKDESCRDRSEHPLWGSKIDIRKSLSCSSLSSVYLKYIQWVLTDVFNGTISPFIYIQEICFLLISKLILETDLRI